MMCFDAVLIFVLCFLPRVVPVNICYLIDDTEEKYEMQHSIEEKIQLVRNISRCLRNKGAVAKIATVVYDNDSAKLGFNFKNIDDILNDGFQKIIAKQRQRRNTQEGQPSRGKSLLSKRVTIRLFTKDGKIADDLAKDSPQTMAFLTAAEAVVAAQSQKDDHISNFKVLIISNSKTFPIMDDVKNYFLNASVEIDALDLSSNGSSDLKSIVSSPSEKHYFHSPVINSGQEPIMNDVCATLSEGSVQNNIQSFFKIKNLFMSPQMKRISSDMKESPQYEYEDIPVEENQGIANGQLDGYIEGDSVEYKWSPHPELESPDAVEDDTPEELYNVEDKKDICKYLHSECSTHIQAGLCTLENGQAQGMKKYCKTTCGFCV